MSTGSGGSVVPTYIVSASYDKQVRLWDAATGRTVRSFVFQDSQVNQLQILPVTCHLAVLGFGVIRLYETSSLLSAGASADGASAGTANSAAPPLAASFESQGTMNFTSVGGIPLLPIKRRDDAGDEHGDTAALNDSSSGLGATCVLNEFGLSTMPPTFGTDDPRGPYAPGLAIYATSEDGHLRFFDGRSLGTLHMVKDIPTGASITCSALSPDRRFLLTGNQMGIVSVWHVPSIIAGASDEYRHRGRGGNTSGTSTTKTAPAEAHVDPEAVAAIGEEGAAAGTHDGIKATTKATKPKKLSYEAQTGSCTAHPLQEIAFGKDYSAIRSIACDPTGHWFVVATNAGKLHFLRFAQDGLLGGSRTRQVSRHESGNDGGAPRQTQATQLDGDDPHSSAPSISSRLDFGGNASNRSSDASGGHGRESIYRSALVVNELSSNARRRASSHSGSSPEGKDSACGVPAALLQHDGSVSAAQGPSSTIGAVLLNSLEQQRGNNSVAAAAAAASMAAGAQSAGTHPGGVTESRTPLQIECELEVFHSFQAHYKYILHVAISPNSQLIVTCSADYTIGRFSVPEFMRAEALSRRTAGNGSTYPVSRRESLPAHEDTLPGGFASNTSITSTQAPARDGHTTATASVASGKGPSSDAHASHPTDPLSVPPMDAAGASASGTVAPSPDSHSRQGEGEAGAHDLVEGRSSPFTSPLDATAELNGDASGSHSFFGSSAVLADSVQFNALKPLMAHNRWVWDCAFSECGDYLFSASSDNHVRMWNGLTSDRPQSTTFVGHTKPVVSVVLFAEPRIAPNA